MALQLGGKKVGNVFLLEIPLVSALRFKTHGNLPKKRRINPFVQRNTDFIKLLCIALIKYERIQTTLERAKKLEKYGNLVSIVTIRPCRTFFLLKTRIGM